MIKLSWLWKNLQKRRVWVNCLITENRKKLLHRMQVIINFKGFVCWWFKKKKSKKINSRTFILWSWRDSNPRPNRDAICFLHAYLHFNCQERARLKTPNSILIFFSFGREPKPLPSYLRFTCTTLSARFEATASGWCLVPTPWSELSELTYYTSVTQQERNCYCQLWFWRFRL